MDKRLSVLVALGLAAALAGTPARTQTSAAAKVKGTPTATPASTPTATPGTGTPAPYTMTDLGSLGAGVTYGLAINANGQITGYSYASSAFQVPCPPQQYGQPKQCFEHPYHAFVWSNGTLTDLGTLGGHFSKGVAINLAGEVVGTADTTTGGDAFLWNGGKSMVDIGAWSPAGINDSGQIAGSCYNASGPCVYNNGTLTQLPNPTTFPSNGCGAVAINNTGQILGSCSDTSGNAHVVVWQNGTATDLGTIGAGPPYEGNSVNAFNTLGQVVGYQQLSTGAIHGFLLGNGKLTDLGNNVLPTAINDSGVVVGNWIYRNGTLQDLNSLIPPGSGFTLDHATGINDKGQIVVNGYNAMGQEHAFLLTPTS